MTYFSYLVQRLHLVMSRRRIAPSPTAKGFWNRPIIVAISGALLIALLGVVGHPIQPPLLERDCMGLIVRTEAFEQAILRVGPLPTYTEHSVLKFINAPKPTQTQKTAAKGFWENATVAGIVTVLLGALLSVIVYFYKKSLPDDTDLIVRTEAFEHAIPSVMPLPAYTGDPVYCEVVRFHLVISHNQRGRLPILLNRIAFEVEPIELNAKMEPLYGYEIDATALQGFGIMHLGQYTFSLDGERVTGRYRKSRDYSEKISTENIFRSTENEEMISVIISPEGDDSVYKQIIVVEASSAGFYHVRLRVDYEIAGCSKKEVTPWIHVLNKE